MDSLLVNDKDRHLASGDLEDADFIYGGIHDRKTRDRVLDETMDRGLNAKALGFRDLEDKDLDNLGEQIEGKTFFYRHKNFTQGLDFEEKVEAAGKLKFLESEYDIKLVNDPLISLVHDSKQASNTLFQHNLHGVEDVRPSEQYDVEEAYDQVEEGAVVAKPDEGSLGDGVEKLESAEEIDNYLEGSKEEIVFEEYIPHDENNHLEDRRAYVVDGEVVATVNRENDEGLATNLAKGGGYVEGSELEVYEEIGLEQAAEGLGFTAVDYVKDTDEDEVIIYEANATPGTKYDDKFGGLIDSLVDKLESSEDRVENAPRPSVEPELSANSSNSSYAVP